MSSQEPGSIRDIVAQHPAFGGEPMVDKDAGSQGQEPEAALEQEPTDLDGEEADEGESLEFETSDGEASEQEGESGKKLGRWAKTKQRMKQAEAQLTKSQEYLVEALDNTDFLASELKTKEAEIEQLYALLNEYGLGPDEKELELSKYKATERRDAFYKQAKEASQKRISEMQQQQQAQAVEAELAEVAQKHNVDVGAVAAYEYAMLSAGVKITSEEAAAAVAATLNGGKPLSPASRQAAKNATAPTVVSQAGGNSAARTTPSTARDFILESLKGSGFR